MRHAVASLGVVALVIAGGCTSDGGGETLSTNAARWQAGSAVVIIRADVAPATGGQPLDISALGRRPGVISVSGDTDSVRIALSRRAELVDLAALKLELERMPGITNVREVFVPPAQ